MSFFSRIQEQAAKVARPTMFCPAASPVEKLKRQKAKWFER